MRVLRAILVALAVVMLCIPVHAQSLPRGKAKAKLTKAAESYLAAVAEAEQDLHSIMVIKNGKVVYERWQSEGKPEVPHVLNSVSKTFTSMAVGLAIAEGKLSLEEKIVDIFPEHMPENPSEYLREITVEHLLTMSCGHSSDPTFYRENKEVSWIKLFMQHPVTHKPGTLFCYNSLGTYMLSAIVQKRTGEKIVDYLYPRFFEPMGIEKPHWEECPEEINTGGWGLFLKTEDLAKTGLMILQKGRFNGKQVVPTEWIEAASTKQVECVPAGMTTEESDKLREQAKTSDWLQGYGYQMWRCRHNAFRADGAMGQYIIMVPEKKAVIAITANIGDMQAELNLIWDYILPAL